jgi:predicted RNA-binding Zn ribbon-like protein
VPGSPVQSFPAPLFVGGHPALDFLNSVASPRGEPVEWIGSGRDLLGWLVRAELVPPAVATRFRRPAARSEVERVAQRARELREWFRGFVQRHAGRPLAPPVVRALAPLNQLLARDAGYRQLEAIPRPAPGRPTPAARVADWRRLRRWATPDALLQPIADALGDLVCDADFRYVRHCEGSGCTLWFLDGSKGHRRRWCSMAMCGNRAKAAMHRVQAKTRRGRD